MNNKMGAERWMNDDCRGIDDIITAYGVDAKGDVAGNSDDCLRGGLVLGKGHGLGLYLHAGGITERNLAAAWWECVVDTGGSNINLATDYSGGVVTNHMNWR